MYLCVCVFVLSHSVVSDSVTPLDHSLPGSSAHGISQAVILEWVAISSSRDLPTPRIEPMSPMSPVLAGGFFTSEPTGKSLVYFTSSISWQKARGDAGGVAASPWYSHGYP